MQQSYNVRPTSAALRSDELAEFFAGLAEDDERLHRLASPLFPTYFLYFYPPFVGMPG